MIAHRPGFVAPTLAARTAATLDHFTNGRIAVHIITGGNDADQQRDGDWLDHDNRYRRTDISSWGRGGSRGINRKSLVANLLKVRVVKSIPAPEETNNGHC